MKKLLLSLFVVFFHVSFSYASLLVTPQRIETSVNPNVPIKASYSVTNNYDGDVTLEVSAEVSKDWSYKSNFDIPVDSWLKIMPSRVTIKKGETRLVLYTITANEKMQGSTVAKIKFKVNPPNSPSVNVLVTVPMHVIIRGTERIACSVDSLIVHKKTEERRLSITIRNSGNVLIHPIGAVNIYRGKTMIDSIKLYEGSSVFPESVSNEFSIQFPSHLQPGKYRAEASIVPVGYNHRIAPSTKSIEFRVLKDGSIVD
ncbi:MAG: hypothetical protein FWH43_07185 [Endomicrobia bacterium]|nr:hypothetical protein [Endomicrobiia bacterium]